MISRAYRFAALAFTVACAPVLAQNTQPAEQPISRAETMLFMTNHLKGAKLPASFDYSFRRDGTMEEKFDDSVKMDVRAKGKDGAVLATARFLSGDRNIKYPPVEHAEGNPVILWFLDRDIKEMERLTGGKSPYFRKRIRLALVDKAELRPVQFSFGGKEATGTEIKVYPYLEDPNKPKFGKLYTKYYVFVLSDQVPGGVYQIRAVVPEDGAAADAKPLIDETLTFKQVAPTKG